MSATKYNLNGYIGSQLVLFELFIQKVLLRKDIYLKMMQVNTFDNELILHTLII